jgi:hypothetical protein
MSCLKFPSLLRVVLLALLSISTCQAEETFGRTKLDGIVQVYANTMNLRNDSVLNPDNRIANLPQVAGTTEARFNLKAENETVRLTLRPIVLAQHERNANSTSRMNEAYLSQWQLRVRTTESSNIAAGREILNWGAAQFRSPSSPIYFDNGRSNPLRELSGVDTLKFSWTPDMQHTLTLARIVGSGHVTQDSWRNSWLLKLDQRSDDWAAGLVVCKTPAQRVFVGAHGQLTVNDAVLLYTEASSSTRSNALQSPADNSSPFTLLPQSQRETTILTGTAYTLQNGQTLNAEMMHYGHGFSSSAESAYFTRATAAPSLAAMALGTAPPLLGRDYLHLVWQSNLMETGGYWRAMATHSFTDNGNELSGYAEYSVNGQVTIFSLAVLPLGNTRQEFSGLYKRSLTAGMKVAL